MRPQAAAVGGATGDGSWQQPRATAAGNSHGRQQEPWVTAGAMGDSRSHGRQQVEEGGGIGAQARGGCCSRQHPVQSSHIRTHTHTHTSTPTPTHPHAHPHTLRSSAPFMFARHSLSFPCHNHTLIHTYAHPPTLQHTHTPCAAARPRCPPGAPSARHATHAVGQGSPQRQQSLPAGAGSASPEQGGAAQQAELPSWGRVAQVRGLQGVRWHASRGARA